MRSIRVVFLLVDSTSLSNRNLLNLKVRRLVFLLLSSPASEMRRNALLQRSRKWGRFSSIAEDIHLAQNVEISEKNAW